MSIQRRIVPIAALLAIATLGWFLLRPASNEPTRAVRADAPAPAPARLLPAAPVSTAPSSSAQTCDGPKLDFVFAGARESPCIGPLSTIQNGSVRTYRVDTRNSTFQSLRIDAIGTRVLRVAVGDFLCKESSCKGVSIGRHDVHGIRVIRLQEAPLTSADSNESLLVSGELRTRPENEVAAASCPGQGVSVVTSDSSTSWFCPNGGAGFELGDDSVKTYRFTNLDGVSILVALDDQQRLKQVRWEGDETLACRSGDCGGMRVSAPGADGERKFTFAGTTLIETSSGQRNAVLNGTLIVPPL